MPTSTQILSGLAAIANTWRKVAIAWHIYLGLLVAAVLTRGLPSGQVMGILLALPLLSVSIAAWSSRNAFNGTLFAVCGIALAAIASGMPAGSVHVGSLWAVIAGALLFALGWVYPHFLETQSFIPYLYAAPTGVVPCPTLLAVTGLALVLGGLGSQAWSLVLGATGVFYGLFGAARLGVKLDWALFVGAAALVVTAL